MVEKVRNYPVWVSYPLKQGLKPCEDGDHHRQGKECLSQLSIKTRIETGSETAISSARWSLSQLSIKTRIETHGSVIGWLHWTAVWVSYPLKQGLKLITAGAVSGSGVCLSQLSIKTRIETHSHGQRRPRQPSSLSQLSIKTRIETFLLCPDHWSGQLVWVSYPLKQGLKQDPDDITLSVIDLVWVSYPLKQGLKHFEKMNLLPLFLVFESAIH